MWFYTEPLSITSVPPSMWLPPACSCGSSMAGVGRPAQLKANPVKDTWFDLCWISRIDFLRSSTDVDVPERVEKLNV